MGVRTRIGQMRHRLTFKEPSEAREADYNEAQLTFNAIANDPDVWARIEPLSGDELVEARQVDSRVTHRITLRYRSDLNTRMIAVEGSREFELVEILNPEEGDRRLVIRAIEKPANA